MKSSILGLCALLSAALPMTSSYADVITLRFSHVVAPETPKGKGAQLFQQLVAQLWIVDPFESIDCGSKTRQRVFELVRDVGREGFDAVDPLP